MSLPVPTPPTAGGERETILLSALNQFLFCARRAALIHVEGIFKANEHTLRGDIAHEHADFAGYEVVKEVALLRALPVWSERLGLTGKCDIVERHPDGTMVPVEFKLGKRRQWENDDVQVCAQALCLEEMFGLEIPRGAIFHATSKRRREVEFNLELRKRTEAAVDGLRALLTGSEAPNDAPEVPRLPSAVHRPACEECSLYDICLPELTDHEDAARRAARRLFQI